MVRFLLKKSSLIILTAAVLLVIMFFFSQKEPLRDFPFGTNSRSSENGKKIVAEIETDFGVMKIELWPEVAPKTVSNFIKLSQEGFYDGTAFHRIISGFMIQGGDPLTKDPANFARYGTGGPGYTIPAEFNDRPHVRGVISMARSSDPNSAGSQFFICHGDAPFLDRQYTAFGRLIEGDEVLDKIAAVPVNISPSGERSQPTQRVEVRKIRILNLQ